MFRMFPYTSKFIILIELYFGENKNRDFFNIRTKQL